MDSIPFDEVYHQVLIVANATWVVVEMPAEGGESAQHYRSCYFHGLLDWI